MTYKFTSTNSFVSYCNKQGRQVPFKPATLHSVEKWVTHLLDFAHKHYDNTYRIQYGAKWIRIDMVAIAPTYKWRFVDQEGNVRKVANNKAKILFNLLTTPEDQWILHHD